MNAVKELIEREKILTMQDSVFPKSLFSDKKYIFSTWPSIDSEVAKTVSFLRAQSEPLKVGVMYLTTPWGEGYAESLKKQISESDGQIAGWESNKIGDSDFRPELTKIRIASPTALFIAHTGTMLSTLLKQASILGPKVSIFVPSDADDESIVAAAGSAAEGISLYSTDAKITTAPMNRFTDSFQARFKVAPTPLARHAYDQLQIVTKAIEECSGERSCAADSIRRLGFYDGVSGPFKIHPNGEADRTFSLKQVRDGRFKFPS